MTRNGIRLALLLGLLGGCADRAPLKTFDMLDTNTGMTLGALIQPIACVQTGTYDPLAPDRQPTIVYLGPVEWDRSGEYRYVLWVQVAPGDGGPRLADIRTHGAFIVMLDDGPMALTAIDHPVEARSPYLPQVPVGQTAYFELNVPMLKRMAASKKFAVEVEAADLTRVELTARPASRGALKRFLVDRNVNED